MHHSSTVFVTFVFFHSECRSWRTLNASLVSTQRRMAEMAPTAPVLSFQQERYRFLGSSATFLNVEERPETSSAPA